MKSAYDLAVHWLMVGTAVAVAAMWLVAAALHLERRGRGRAAGRPRLRGADVPPVLLAALLSAGALHTAPGFNRLPIDLGVLLIAMLSVATLHQFAEHLSDHRALEVWPVVLVVAIAALGYARSPHTAYADHKVSQLVVTVGAVVCAVLLLHNEAARTRFLQGIVAVGVVTLVISIAAPSSDVALGRVAATGATTIATGRMAGGAVVVLVALIAAGRLRPLVWAPVVVALGALMFETGSRGPLVAAGIAFAVLLLVTGTRRPGRALVLAAALLAVGYVAWGQASQVSRNRIDEIASSDKGASVEQRQFMWSRSWDLAQHSLWGRGWGGLEYLLAVDRYPHNVFLEVLVEAGWVAAGLLLVFLVGAARRAHAARLLDPTATPLLALLIFWTVNALVSGDVNDNRGLFVLMTACWMLGLRSGRSGLGAHPRVEPSRGERLVHAVPARVVGIRTHFPESRDLGK